MYGENCVVNYEIDGTIHVVSLDRYDLSEDRNVIQEYCEVYYNQGYEVVNPELVSDGNPLGMTAGQGILSIFFIIGIPVVAFLLVKFLRGTPFSNSDSFY